MTIEVSLSVHSTSASALPGKQNKRNMRWNEHKRQENILDIIDYNLKKNYKSLIIPDTAGHQMTVQIPTSPNVCFCATSENQN